MKKLTTDEIRRVILNQLSDVKDYILSAHAVALVKELSNNPTTSAKLAKAKKISIQNASRQLHQLYIRGYLQRVELPDPTGGMLWAYWSTYDFEQ